MINLKTKKIKSIKAVVIITAILAVLALIANFLLYADAFKDDQKIYTDQTEYEAKVGESFNLNTKAKTDITYKEIMKIIIEHATEEGCHQIFCDGGVNMCPSDIFGPEKIDKQKKEG